MPGDPVACDPGVAGAGGSRSRRSGRIWVTAIVARPIPIAPATATTGVPNARRRPPKAGTDQQPDPLARAGRHVGRHEFVRRTERGPG